MARHPRWKPNAVSTDCARPTNGIDTSHKKKIGAGWVAWGFIWVILLTPWWAWWFPVAFFPIWGWWLSRSSYTWREFSTKYCWILPFAWLPWFGYMLLLYCLDAVSLG